MKVSASRVLLIEDDPKMLEVLSALLQDDHVTLENVAHASEVFPLLGKHACDLIVLTAWNSTNDKLRGFELGAADYITKPFEAAEFRARIRRTLIAKQLQDELTQTNRELVTARMAAESAGRAKAEFLAN